MAAKETYFTTGQFRKGGDAHRNEAADRYRRHCGPTAITNLVISAAARTGREEHMPADAQEIFDRVASIGMHRLFYWNTNMFRRIGGTSDLLVGPYIRSCFSAYELKQPRLHVQWIPSEAAMVNALQKGAVLYLQVHMQPKYGNHHMICYGYEVPMADRSADGRNVKAAASDVQPPGNGIVPKKASTGRVSGKKCLFFRIADGWVSRPVRMTFEELCRMWLWVVEVYPAA